MRIHGSVLLTCLHQSAYGDHPFKQQKTEEPSVDILALHRLMDPMHVAYRRSLRHFIDVLDLQRLLLFSAFE